MYKLCVFDMDGTVVNSIGDIAAAMNRSLSALGYKTYGTEEYCHMVGDGMEVLCRRAIPSATEEELQNLIALYKEDYLNNCCEESVVYDGIDEILRLLNDKGIKRAILSNKPHEQVMEIAKELFEDDSFDEIMGYTPRFPIKPAPDSLLHIMDKFGVSKEETVFIGDSNVDIRLGKAAGVIAVGVAWGFRGKQELEEEGADFVASTVEELREFLIKE